MEGCEQPDGPAPVCRLAGSLFPAKVARHSTLLLAKKAWLELKESLNKIL